MTAAPKQQLMREVPPGTTVRTTGIRSPGQVPAAGPFRSGDSIIKPMQPSRTARPWPAPHGPSAPAPWARPKKRSRDCGWTDSTLPVEERVNIVRAAFEGTGVHSRSRRPEAARRSEALPRWSWQGPPLSLWGAIRSDVPWIKFSPVGSSILIIGLSRQKCNWRIQTFPALSSPDPESSSEKRGDPPRDMLWDACVPPGPPLSPRHRMVRSEQSSNPHKEESCIEQRNLQRPDRPAARLFRHTPLLCRAGWVPMSPFSREWVHKNILRDALSNGTLFPEFKPALPSEWEGSTLLQSAGRAPGTEFVVLDGHLSGYPSRHGGPSCSSSMLPWKSPPRRPMKSGSGRWMKSTAATEDNLPLGALALELPAE